MTSFCQAADLAPSDPRPYQFLGEMYGVVAGAERRDHDAAGPVRRAAADERERPVLLRDEPVEGAAAIGAGPDLARVEALLRQAAALDPKHAKARSAARHPAVGAAALARGDRGAAGRHALEPDLAQAHYRLAQAYRRTGQPALADRELAIFEA